MAQVKVKPAAWSAGPASVAMPPTDRAVPSAEGPVGAGVVNSATGATLRKLKRTWAVVSANPGATAGKLVSVARAVTVRVKSRLSLENTVRPVSWASVRE